jgi:hypothetical protein
MDTSDHETIRNKVNFLQTRTGVLLYCLAIYRKDILLYLREPTEISATDDAVAGR